MVKWVLIMSALLSTCAVTAYSQNKSPILDAIEQSLTKCEPAWKLERSDRSDDISVPQAWMDWTDGKDRIGAYITVFPSSGGAANNLEPTDGDGPSVKLAGVGDEAYLWAPNKTSKDYIVRFRKAGALVFLSSPAEKVAKWGAGCIAESVPPLGRYLQLVPQPQTRSDVCHVYVVDGVKARKAFDEYRDTGNPEADSKALAAATTGFPEFRTEVGEEALTTKTYRFPGSNLTITASVYYTDESMASTEGVDSMLLGIVVSPSARKDAISAEDNAVSEITLNGRDTVRAKKYVKVNSRLYLVGIECRSGGVNDLQ